MAARTGLRLRTVSPGRVALPPAHGPPEVVLDCRWLHFWGIGRVTELLLRGLAQDPPDEHWLLWGPPAIESFAWSGASTVVTARDPRALRGQRPWFDMPRGRVAVFLHQQRPLRRMRSVTLVHDTIQLRYARTPFERLLRTVFLRRAVAVSDQVVTISEYSRACIGRDLRVPLEDIPVVSLPLDLEVAARIAARRHAAPVGDVALFTGRFAAHKNLARLRVAFARTDFRAGGGRLLLVGGSPQEVADLRASLDGRERAYVEVRGWCDRAELEELMATCRFVVQPSMEEGFGLPVVEAMAGGVTVCVSDGGALPEITAHLVRAFPAVSVEAMAEAIDQAADAAADRATETRLAARVRARMPSPAEFASELRAIVDRTRRLC